MFKYTIIFAAAIVLAACSNQTPAPMAPPSATRAAPAPVERAPSAPVAAPTRAAPAPAPDKKDDKKR